MSENEYITAEAWRPVIGFETQYEISDWGRIRNIKGRPLKISNFRGYSRISLYRRSRGSKRHTNINQSIHRLVMEAFVGPANGLHVNHVDGNKVNNRLENLEYVTPKENSDHAYRIGLRDHAHERKLTWAIIHDIRDAISKGIKSGVLAKKHNLCYSTVSKIRRNVVWIE